MMVPRTVSFLLFLFVVLFKVFIHAEVYEETENGIIFRDPLKDRRLENNLLKTVSTLSIVECSLECLRDRCCLSVNYGKDLNNMKEHDCELNEGKVSTSPEDFTRNSSYLYYEIVDTGNGFRVEPCSKALGDSKDFPGKNCNDIKLHTNTSVSEEYWIKPNDTVTPFLVYCEMKLYEGGWTLVYSYTFTNYTNFYMSSNAVVPRPNWKAPTANVTISTVPPLKDKHGAIEFQYWQYIGDEFFIRSNINNWYKCTPNGGSLVKTIDGAIICKNLTDIGIDCNTTIPEKIVWDNSGPVLRDNTRPMYRFDGSTSAWYPVHNSCKSSSLKNHKRDVTNPYGQIFLRKRS